MAHLEHPSGRPREQSTDFFVLPLEYSDELSAAYISRMEQIVGKVLSSRKFAVADIREALPGSADYPYSGFDAICATSSGNPQDLLLICSAIFAAWRNADGSADQAFEPVPRRYSMTSSVRGRAILATRTPTTHRAVFAGR